MKMKKIYFIIAFLLAAAVILGGCAKNGSDLPSSAASSGETESVSSFDSELPEAQTAVINVFVPSTMTLAMNDIIEAYSKAGGGRVVANYSDCTSLSGQIKENADCDIFICDDPAILDDLSQGGYLQADTRKALSDKEVALIVQGGEKKDKKIESARSANVEKFYEFLLSEEALQIMNESYDVLIDPSGHTYQP